MAESIVTAERVRAILDYNPETGVFTRKVRLAQRHQVGDRADLIVTGGGLKGYYRVSFDSQRFLAHRLAWLYVHGEWPANEIDHIDGNPSNNRISNLRDVTGSVNLQNMRRPRKHGSSGYLGVYWNPSSNSWVARIQKDRKSMHIGCFSTPEEAHQAYLSAKRKIHSAGCTI